MPTFEKLNSCDDTISKIEMIIPSTFTTLVPSFPHSNKYSPPTTERYNKLCGSLRSFAHRISILSAQDPFRSKMEAQLLAKLYDMGVLNSTAKLSDIENKLTVAAFCRRRLAVIMVVSKMAQTVSAVSMMVSMSIIRLLVTVLTLFSVGCEIYRTGTCQSGS